MQGGWHAVHLDTRHVARDPSGMVSRHEKAIAFGFVESDGNSYLGQRLSGEDQAQMSQRNHC